MAGFEGGVRHAAPAPPATGRGGHGRCGGRAGARGVGMVVVASWCDRDGAPWRRHESGRGPLVGGRHGRGHACRVIAPGCRAAVDERGLTTAQQVMQTMIGCARLPRTRLRAPTRSGRSPGAETMALSRHTLIDVVQVTTRLLRT